MKSLPMLALVSLVALVGLAPSHAAAFELTGIGARVGDVDPEGASSSVAVGGHLEFEQSGTHLHLQPGVEYWSSDGLQDVNPNFDAMYHFAAAGRVSPYLGAGLGIHFYSADLAGGGSASNTDLGMNMFGGVLVPSGSTTFFGEARYVATDRSQFGIHAGVTLPLGRH